LIIFAIWFATVKLIPMGKDYRKNKIILKKEQVDLQRYEDFHKQTLQTFNETKQKNRHIIQAFENKFQSKKFIAIYSKYFIDLKLSKAQQSQKNQWYEVYDVNTTSKIKSPKNFYDFLDALNKGEWIVSVDFPIHFQREGELLHSSFSMKVYKKSPQTTPTNENNSSN